MVQERRQQRCRSKQAHRKPRSDAGTLLRLDARIPRLRCRRREGIPADSPDFPSRARYWIGRMHRTRSCRPLQPQGCSLGSLPSLRGRPAAPDRTTILGGGLSSGSKPISASTSPDDRPCVPGVGSGFSGLSAFPVTFAPPDPAHPARAASCLQRVRRVNSGESPKEVANITLTSLAAFPICSVMTQAPARYAAIGSRLARTAAVRPARIVSIR